MSIYKSFLVYFLYFQILFCQLYYLQCHQQTQNNRSYILTFNSRFTIHEKNFIKTLNSISINQSFLTQNQQFLTQSQTTITSRRKLQIFCQIQIFAGRPSILKITQKFPLLNKILNQLSNFKRKINIEKCLKFDLKVEKNKQMTNQMIQELVQKIIWNRSKQQNDEQQKLFIQNYQQKLQEVNQMLIQSQENVQKAETIKKKLNQNQILNKYYPNQSFLNYFFARGIYNTVIIENIQLKKRLRQKLIYYLKLKSEKNQNLYKKIRKTETQLKIINLKSFNKSTQKYSLQDEQQRVNYRKFRNLQNNNISNRKSKSLNTYFLLKDIDTQTKKKQHRGQKQKIELNKNNKDESSQNKPKNSLTINWFVNDCIKHRLKQIRNKNKISELKIQKLKIAIQQIQKRILISKLKQDVNQKDEQIYEQQMQCQNDSIQNKKLMLVLLEADIFNSKYQIRQACLPFPQKIKTIKLQKNNSKKQFIKNRIKQWPNLNNIITVKRSFIEKYSRLKKIKSQTHLQFAVGGLNFQFGKDSKKQIKKTPKKGLTITIKQSQKKEQKQKNKQILLTVSSSSQNNANQQLVNIRQK